MYLKRSRRILHTLQNTTPNFNILEIKINFSAFCFSFKKKKLLFPYIIKIKYNFFLIINNFYINDFTYCEYFRRDFDCHT